MPHDRAEASPGGVPYRLAPAPGHTVVTLTGRLTLAEADAIWGPLRHDLASIASGQSVDLVLDEVESIDGGVLALLVRLKLELETRGAAVQFTGGSEAMRELVHLYRGDVVLRMPKRRKPLSTLASVGKGTAAGFGEAKQVVAFIGRVAVGIRRTAHAPGSVNWREVPHIMERAGADAVPIVILINLLVGFVMGYQAAVQLKQFGANIFVADLVGLSTTRELGPLMTAIIVCGRSGAAFAAELGSMKVAEEIDALHTMGFGAVRYLVIPRVVGLLLVVPLLTLIADVVAIVGGLVVGLVSLDLTVVAYLSETQKAVHPWDVWSGILKSAVFAIAIGITSCQQGLAASGGAEGVGRRTTSSVVAILFFLILIDAMFTILFNVFGL